MNPISLFIAVILFAAAAANIRLGASMRGWSNLPATTLAVSCLLLLLGVVVLVSLRMAKEWQRAIVLRNGRKHGCKGPGLYFVMPVIDSVTKVVDQRIEATPFATEKTLTRDTTPVDVDAIIFWMVTDPELAALQVVDYRTAVALVSQTSLREVIGAAVLSELLSEREKVDQRLQEIIGAKTAEWGISVKSVEVRDVSLPDILQDAMSRQAQAEREKGARVTLASAEVAVVEQLELAATVYDRCPTALRVLTIQRTFEMNKERGTTILLPTELASSMAPAAIATALTSASPALAG